MAEAKGSGQGVITLSIPDMDTLYRSYMVFVQGGGLFVPTTRAFRLGDEVFLLLTLVDDPQRHGVTGKVVWINARPTSQRPVGIGVQFVGTDGAEVQQRIETYLAGRLEGAKQTFTL